MIKLTNFCGIFATVFVTTTIILLASCSQDDDNYDSDMYTMAEMGTRLGGKGDPGGNDPTPPTLYNGNPIQAGLDTIKFEVAGYEIETFVGWSRGYTGLSAPVSNISIVPHYWDTLQYSGLTYINSTGEWFGYNNGMRIRVNYIDNKRIKYYLHECYPKCVPDSTLQPL